MSTATIEQATRDDYARNIDNVRASKRKLDQGDRVTAKAFAEMVGYYVQAGAFIYEAGVAPNMWARWAQGITTSAQWSEHVAKIREEKKDPKAQVAPKRRESYTRALVLATCVVEQYAGDVDAMRTEYESALDEGDHGTLLGIVAWCKGGDTAKVSPSAESSLRSAVRKGAREGMTLEQMVAVMTDELEQG